jgi:hypothetical protein
MSRKWTARKATTLDVSAIDSEAFSPAYPIFRPGPEPAAARRQASRLLAGYTLLWLPVHCGVLWLAARSPGLAAGVVLATAGALFAVALAKWLGLEEVLQRLPLLLGLGLLAVGLAYLTAQPREAWAGIEFVGGVFLLVVAVSVLGGLYRPLAAAYQTVTLNTPVRDLCVGAGAALVSLGVALLAVSIPRAALELLAWALTGGFAGLVVLEYTAWARANPDVGLERALEFDPKEEGEDGGADAAGPCANALDASLFGACLGALALIAREGLSPTEGLGRLLLPLAGGDPKGLAELLGSVFLFALVAGTVVFIQTTSALNGRGLPRPFLACRVAWDAVVLFVTYPDVKHPLAHRLRTPWLRPVSVRLALSGAVLLTVATALFVPAEKRPGRAPDAPAAAPAAPPERWRYEGAHDPEVARALGMQPGAYASEEFVPPQSSAAGEPPAPGQPPGSADSTLARYVTAAAAAALGPPAVLFLVVCLLGLVVLPTYFDYFEKPEDPKTAG